MSRQETRLQNARDIVKHNARRAQKLVEGDDDWRIFQASTSWTTTVNTYQHRASVIPYIMGVLCMGAMLMRVYRCEVS